MMDGSSTPLDSKVHPIMVHQQRPDGSWGPATPIGPQGPIAKVEFWLRARGWTRLANLLGRIDERGL